jgi:excisionase family DNA binding protein
MTPREVARLARRSDESVYRAIHSHELPARRVSSGKRALFKVRRADALAWMAGPGDEGDDGWT